MDSLQQSPFVGRLKPSRGLGEEGNAVFKRNLNQVAADTEKVLNRLLAAKPISGETLRPARLLNAMRYASLGGGKRLRPFLVVETSRLFNVPRRQALLVAAALECVHCYSLVHDDLPAMDDDLLRRGRLTVHKAFDEATAILAGDGLLTLAFDILSRPEIDPDPAIRIRLVSALARAGGVGGMVGGQMLDLASEGRFESKRMLKAGEIKTLQAMKTGALLQFACTSGAVLGRAKKRAYNALNGYGAAIGEAFQLADDLLDVDGDAAIVGKETDKDAAAHKATFIQLLGVQGARDRLHRLVHEAEEIIAIFGEDAANLVTAAHFVADRRS